MRRKVGLIIPHPEEQKYDSVWKIFRTPNLNLPTLAALIPEAHWDIDIQHELVGPIDFTRDYDLALITVTTSVGGEHVVYRPAKMTVEELCWGQKWAKGHFYSYGSIGKRMVMRAKQQGVKELFNTMGAGLGYRSMSQLSSDDLAVDVYRDLRHLPPQPSPVTDRLPSIPPYSHAQIS